MAIACDCVCHHEICEALHMPRGLQDHLWCYCWALNLQHERLACSFHCQAQSHMFDRSSSSLIAVWLGMLPSATSIS